MTEKTDVHVNLYEYQVKWAEDEGYNLSALLRREMDGKIIEDGEDPEIVEASYS